MTTEGIDALGKADVDDEAGKTDVGAAMMVTVDDCARVEEMRAERGRTMALDETRIVLVD